MGQEVGAGGGEPKCSSAQEAKDEGNMVDAEGGRQAPGEKAADPAPRKRVLIPAQTGGKE